MKLTLVDGKTEAALLAFFISKLVLSAITCQGTFLFFITSILDFMRHTTQQIILSSMCVCVHVFRVQKKKITIIGCDVCVCVFFSVWILNATTFTHTVRIHNRPFPRIESV